MRRPYALCNAQATVSAAAAEAWVRAHGSDAAIERNIVFIRTQSFEVLA
jgi:hypothetical protein